MAEIENVYMLVHFLSLFPLPLKFSLAPLTPPKKKKVDADATTAKRPYK